MTQDSSLWFIFGYSILLISQSISIWLTQHLNCVAFLYSSDLVALLALSLNLDFFNRCKLFPMYDDLCLSRLCVFLLSLLLEGSMDHNSYTVSIAVEMHFIFHTVEQNCLNQYTCAKCWTVLHRTQKGRMYDEYIHICIQWLHQLSCQCARLTKIIVWSGGVREHYVSEISNRKCPWIKSGNCPH